ncbi:hypothetical protein Tco_0099126 [Tanacetum coccineum]
MKKDITREGFHNKNNVADLISNGVWLWPQSWIRKAPELAQIVVPTIVESSPDTWQWKDRNGTLGAFSVAKNSLKTQDQVRQWDVGSDTDLNLLRCALCKAQGST